MLYLFIDLVSKESRRKIEDVLLVTFDIAQAASVMLFDLLKLKGNGDKSGTSPSVKLLVNM